MPNQFLNYPLPHLYKRVWLFLWLLALGISSCKKDPEAVPTQQLVANAGPDQQVPTQQVVQLNGSASRSSNGQSFSYLWTFKTKPAGSTATLVEAATAQPTFSPDVAGVYVISLKISNSAGQASDEVMITAAAAGQPNVVILDADITQDRVLEDIFPNSAQPDYLVTNQIAVSAQLTIRPGVIIAFAEDKGLRITTGALIAKGTADQPVVFTGTSQTKGYWRGIAIYSNSPQNEMEHTIVEYAGSSNLPGLPFELKANVALLAEGNSAAALRISHTTVSEGGGFGLYVHGRSQLTHFANNTFRNHLGSALYVPVGQLHRLDAASSLKGNNGFNGVQTSGTLKEEAEVSWPVLKEGASYYVSSDLSIESGLKLNEGTLLQLNAGVVIRITDGGYLRAVGSPSQLIRFTAHTQQPNQYWGGLLFQSAHALNQLHYTEISYAGNKGLPEVNEVKASIAVGASGRVSVQHSSLRNSLGWGIAAHTQQGAQLNDDVRTANNFDACALGKVLLIEEVPATALAGEWLDRESFLHKNAMDEKLYDRATNRWFRGASSPWTMTPKAGFGLKIEEDGKYVWTIVEYAPWSECGNSYSAEYITGQVSQSGNTLSFQESYWRTFFHHNCDASQNIDMDVQPGGMNLPYEIFRDDVLGSQNVWVLRLTNPDGSTFSYYRRSI